MEACKICGKHKSEDKLPSRSAAFAFDVPMLENDAELSKFMYRLTKKLLTSRNFSDENINRICENHFSETNYPNKDLLRRAIVDLKAKLNIHNATMDKLPKVSRQMEMVDKIISTQSFPNVSDLVSTEKPSSISSITTYESLDMLNTVEKSTNSRRSSNSTRTNGIKATKSTSSSSSSFGALTRMVAASKKNETI